MNTLAHIAGLMTIGFLTAKIFVNYSEPTLGFVGIVVFAWVLPSTWVAIQDDRQIYTGRE